MSLDDKNENIEWCKRAFESDLENKCDTEIQNVMTCIYGNKVNKLAECNLLHDILNPSKRNKISNFRYSYILHRCMHTWKGRETFKNFLILFHSGFGSTIVIKILITKIDPIEDAVVQRHTQAGNIITNIRIKLYFTLLELRAKKIMMWDCRLD